MRAQLVDLLLAQGFPLSHSSDGKRRVVCLDVCEFLEDWMVAETQLIGGVCVATLPSIRKQKELLGRDKDIADIALIDEFLRRSHP